jgi:hypothetical protein
MSFSVPSMPIWAGTQRNSGSHPFSSQICYRPQVVNIPACARVETRSTNNLQQVGIVEETRGSMMEGDPCVLPVLVLDGARSIPMRSVVSIGP